MTAGSRLRRGRTTDLFAPRPPAPRPLPPSPPQRLGPKPLYREWEDDPRPETDYRRPGYTGPRNNRGNYTEEQCAQWRAEYTAKRKLQLAREFRERNRELRRWQKRVDRRAARDLREGRI